MKDYYYLLGVDYNATKTEISEAYRKLATKFHPDKNRGDAFFEMRFKEINEAHHTLSDRERRSLFDMEWRQFQEELNARQSSLAGMNSDQDLAKANPIASKWHGVRNLRGEFIEALLDRKWLFLAGGLVLIASLYVTQASTSGSTVRFVLDGILIVLLSIAFSGAVTFLEGSLRSYDGKYAGKIFKSMPIYVIIICLFRWLAS